HSTPRRPGRVGRAGATRAAARLHRAGAVHRHRGGDRADRAAGLSNERPGQAHCGNRGARARKRCVTVQPANHSHIIEQIVSMVAERGYAQTKVSEVTARTDVTRAHFYELFKDKEDCFLEAQRKLAATMVEEVRQSIAAAPAGAAAQAVLAALTDFAEQRAPAFTFITHEA